jgi:two-component system OmpR family response regulator
MRILVVENDELIGTAIARALHDAAYVADWVTDAPSAMDALLSREHDAVLLD